MKKINESNTICLNVRIQPKASNSGMSGYEGDILKIRVHSPPSEGEANRECIGILSKEFKVAKSFISIISGDKSRNKVVRIENIPAEKIDEHLKKYNIKKRGEN